MSMTREEAIELLRDTPIDIRSTREDDIHTLYATGAGGEGAAGGVGR